VIEALQQRLGITLPHEKSAKPSWGEKFTPYSLLTIH
jgi:hypothetical protein